MFNKFLSLNVPIQGIPLFTYILFGATTIILAVVTFNETSTTNNENGSQTNNESNILLDNATDYNSTGGKHKQSKKRRQSKKNQQSKKHK